MTFLELCQAACRDSRTVSNLSTLASVTTAGGRQLTYVNAVRDAWTQIQVQRPDWLWLKKEFEKDTTTGEGQYDPIADWGLTRWSNWVGDVPQTGFFPVSIRDDTIGLTDENPIRQISGDVWRQAYGRGAQIPQRPSDYAFGNDGKLCLGPIPDKVYKVRGLYQASPQILTDDADVPEMPAQFHDLIKWRAIAIVASGDGQFTKNQAAMASQMPIYSMLVRSQTGSPSLAGPLA